MAEKIIMPKAGMAMESGTIVEWLKEVGDHVAYGEPLLEIETDKTTMQVEAMHEGYLLKKLYYSGDEVPVVTTIGYIGAQGEAPPADESKADGGESPAPTGASSAVAPGNTASNAGESPAPTGAPSGPLEEAPPPVRAEGGAAGREAAGNPAAREGVAGGAVLATPAARRLARERNIALSGLFTGAILHARDIPAKQAALAELAAPARQAALADHGGGGAPIAGQPGDTLIPHNGMRRTIARRMLQAHSEIPPVTLNTEADVTELSRFRAQMNAGGDAHISYNDLIVLAAAVALSEYPAVNATYTPEGILRHGHIHIGIAVALEDGLVVPVLRDTDKEGLRALSNKSRALAAAARENVLPPDAYAGGTFTVSNLGMFGITSFTPIINLPEAAILGVCAITERPVLASEHALENRKFMGLSLTFDHRAMDGALGAKFLQRVVGLLQNPVELILMNAK